MGLFRKKYPTAPPSQVPPGHATEICSPFCLFNHNDQFKLDYDESFAWMTLKLEDCEHICCFCKLDLDLARTNDKFEKSRNLNQF